MFFLLFLLDARRIRIQILTSDLWIRIREAQNMWIWNTALYLGSLRDG
jgi:hypothetical protein